LLVAGEVEPLGLARIVVFVGFPDRAASPWDSKKTLIEKSTN
jgi:hypothetical protein